MTPDEEAELFNLYHLARTGLPVMQAGNRVARVEWAVNAFCKEHPDIDRTKAYVLLDNETAPRPTKRVKRLRQ